MPSSIIRLAKQSYPEYRNLSDDELTLRYAREFPEYLKNQDFKADYDRITRPQAPVEAPKPQAGAVESLGRGLLGGHQALGGSLWKGTEYLSRLAGIDSLAQEAKENYEQARSYNEMQRNKSAKTGLAGFARMVGEAAPSLLPVIATAGAGLPAAVAASGLTGGLSTLGTAEDAYKARYLREGMSEEEASSKARTSALLPATLSGITTAVVTRAFGATGVEAISGLRSTATAAATAEARQLALTEARQILTQRFVPAVATGAVKEIAEESVDQAAQSVIEKMSYNPELTFAQAIENVMMAGAVGGVLGGGVTAAMRPISVKGAREVVAADVAEKQAATTVEEMKQAQIRAELQREFDESGEIPADVMASFQGNIEARGEADAVERRRIIQERRSAQKEALNQQERESQARKLGGLTDAEIAQVEADLAGAPKTQQEIVADAAVYGGVTKVRSQGRAADDVSDTIAKAAGVTQEAPNPAPLLEAIFGIKEPAKTKPLVDAAGNPLEKTPFEDGVESFTSGYNALMSAKAPPEATQLGEFLNSFPPDVVKEAIRRMAPKVSADVSSKRPTTTEGVLPKKEAEFPASREIVQGSPAPQTNVDVPQLLTQQEVTGFRTNASGVDVLPEANRPKTTRLTSQGTWTGQEAEAPAKPVVQEPVRVEPLPKGKKLFANEQAELRYLNDLIKRGKAIPADLATKYYHHADIPKSYGRVRHAPSDGTSAAPPAQPEDDTTTTDRKYAAAERDADSRYLELAKEPEKNNAELQRMVDEAAMAAGYNVGPVFHGTSKQTEDFTVFRTGTGNFTHDKKMADSWGKARAFYLKMERPLRVEDDSLWIRDEFLNQLIELNVISEKTADDLMRRINTSIASHGERFRWIMDEVAKKGYDGFEYDNVWEGGGISYKPFNPSQIKSADPITRDAQGNVIPLSMRFDKESSDIRYAAAERDAELRNPEAEVRATLIALMRLLGVTKLPANIKVIWDENGEFAGQYNKDTGEIIINAAQTSDPEATLMEEALHAVWDDPEVQAAWQAVKDTVTGADVEAQAKRHAVMGTTDEAILMEEAAVAKVVNSSDGVVARLLNAIRRALRKLLGVHLPLRSMGEVRQAAINKLISGIDKTKPYAETEGNNIRYAPPSRTQGSPPLSQTVNGEDLLSWADKLKKGLWAGFHPLTALHHKLAKSIKGYEVATRLAAAFENLAGVAGIAKKNSIEFRLEMQPLIEGIESDFNEYLFWQYAAQRTGHIEAANATLAILRPQLANKKLSHPARDGIKKQIKTQEDIANKFRFGKHNYASSMRNLSKLRAKLTADGNLARADAAVDAYGRHTTKALTAQLESGYISQNMFLAYKNLNPTFYPIVQTGLAEGSDGYSISRGIVGIDNPNFKIEKPMDAADIYIYRSHAKAESNKAKLYLYHLARKADNPDVARVIPAGGTAKYSTESAVTLRLDGQDVSVVVDPAVAECVALSTRASFGVLEDLMAKGSSLLRFGATTASAAFQIKNFLLSDFPTLALMSKAGVTNPANAIDFVFKVVTSFSHAFRANILQNYSPEYLTFMESGAMGTSLHSAIDRMSGRGGRPIGSVGLVGHLVDYLGAISHTIEQTPKIAGFRILLKRAGINALSQLSPAEQVALVSEVRNYCGSPDFARVGSAVKQMRAELLFVFLRAGIAGQSSALERLTGNLSDMSTQGERSASAVAQVRAGFLVGLAAYAAYALNHMTDELREDYERVPDVAKGDAFYIPTDEFDTTSSGEKVRRYITIPKRGFVKVIANPIEAYMGYTKSKSPAAFSEMLVKIGEELMPLDIKGKNAEERIMGAASSVNPIVRVPVEYATGFTFYSRSRTVPRRLESASVDRQYTERTNENVKSIATLIGVSPLKLEQVMTSMTGGMSRSAFPRKDVEGNEGSPASVPLVRSFISPPYREPVDGEMIDRLFQEAADASTDRKRLATQFVKSRAGMDEGTIYTQAKEQLGVKNRDVVEKVRELLLAQRSGVTDAESRIIQLPPKQRAQLIMHQLARTSPQDRARRIQSLINKRVITRDTAMYMEAAGFKYKW